MPLAARGRHRPRPRRLDGIKADRWRILVGEDAERSLSGRIGVLAYDVTNGGRKMILNLLDDASGGADTNNPKTAQDIGLGLERRAVQRAGSGGGLGAGQDVAAKRCQPSAGRDRRRWRS